MGLYVGDGSKQRGNICIVKNINSQFDHTITFFADDEPYEAIGVKSGNSINAPATIPTSENGSFLWWELADGTQIEFPYTPTGNIGLNALFGSLADRVYEHYGVSKADYPCCAISFHTFSKKLFVYFATTATCASASSNLNLNAPCLTGSVSYSSFSDFDNVESVIQYTFDNIKSVTETTSSYQVITRSNTISYINFDKGVFAGTAYKI